MALLFLSRAKSSRIIRRALPFDSMGLFGDFLLYGCFAAPHPRGGIARIKETTCDSSRSKCSDRFWIWFWLVGPAFCGLTQPVSPASPPSRA